RTADRRLRRRLHPARLAQLHRRRRHRLDHVHRHLHPVSGGKARTGCAENFLHHHYRNDHGADRGHHPGRDLHAAVRRLDVPRLHARADAALRSSHAHPAPGADLLLCWRSRFGGVALAPFVLVAGIRPADLQRVHHRRWSHRRAPDRNRLPCLRRPRRQHRRPISDQRARSSQNWHRIPPLVRFEESRFPPVGAALHPADAGRFARYRRRLDPPLLRLEWNRRHRKAELCQTSLPFFSRLFGEKKFEEFAATVNASVYRITAASLLITGWMMAIALPLIDLVYRRGRFTFADSESTALYFFVFSLSLALWSCQALYARAFYASSNTLTPMIATSLITLVSLPMYALFFRTLSVTGLAIASDLGITANALAIALLLHIRGMVPLGGMNWKELGKAALVG